LLKAQPNRPHKNKAGHVQSKKQEIAEDLPWTPENDSVSLTPLHGVLPHLANTIVDPGAIVVKP